MHPDPFGPGIRPLPGSFSHFDMLPPPEIMEQKLAAQHVEMQRLAAENQRLAATHTALRQELAGAQQELQRLQAQIGAMKNEKELQMRGLMDRIAKMEVDLQAAEPVKLELQQARSDAQSLIASRQELVSKVQQLAQDLQRSHADGQHIPALMSELDGLKQEYQHCRATYDYEKKLYNDHLESLQVMEKNYVSMVREVEKLRAELANTTNLERRTAVPYGGTTGYKENEAAVHHPVGQNAYEDGYGVPQGRGPPGAAAAAAAPPYGGGPPGPTARAGYDAARAGYDAPRGPGYDAPRGPGYDAPRGPGYDAQRGPGYEAPRVPVYDAPPRGVGGPQGQVTPGNSVPYGSATPPGRAGAGGYEVPQRATEEESLADGFGFRSSGSEGMKSVVASVSGYHGMERFKLIKLITQTGANYVGTMTRSTTHLVCWKFEGRKYELAKNFGTMIVSHRWFENCAKEGKRLPEDPYVMMSGQQVGPLLWDLPVGKKNSSLAGTSGKVLHDRSNVHTDTIEQEIDVGCTDVGEVAWIGSHLLSENLFPPSRTNNKDSYKIKGSTTQKTLKQELKLRNKCSLDPLVSGVVRVQNEESTFHSSMPSGSHKRNVCSVVGSTSSAKPTRKSRRLVKNNALEEILNSSVFEYGQAFSPPRAGNHLNNISAASNDINTMRHEIGQASIDAAHDDSTGLRNENDQEDGFHDYREDRNDGPVEVEGMAECINQGPSDKGKGHLLRKPHLKHMTTPQEKTLKNGLCDFEKDMGEALGDAGELREWADLSTSTEPSCVICWTDFSSTRGVLPCGHRFCYSCIQDWADHMGSSRKVATCPLCKVRFKSITKLDCAASSDQKIYSQTIPYSSPATDIFMLPDQETSNFGGQSAGLVCCECRCQEPEDLLISCHLCHNRWIHSYCLDPPLDPWACLHCRDLRSLYYHMR
ncbi:hypothetical protein NE237_021872 [Protea cynaroides]|uniref:RING-type E3 ubiquitin transferase BRCA1 n=1 Tax=Protea cynaroides TaxID=273540 RepID=A0A9Q0HDB9_9MAGN|nr:hypothetical protein NE237_021872 [Protea cynaroides]